MIRIDVRRSIAWAALASAALYAGCGTDAGAAGGANGSTGATCKAASECYLGVDPTILSGTATCLSVSNGYCTHSCTSDADCCSAKGECPSGRKEVCSPFESSGQMFCFLSCEGADVGSDDPTAYCTQFSNAAFSCRSTGGGAKNRKVCSP